MFGDKLWPPAEGVGWGWELLCRPVTSFHIKLGKPFLIDLVLSTGKRRTNRIMCAVTDLKTSSWAGHFFTYFVNFCRQNCESWRVLNLIWTTFLTPVNSHWWQCSCYSRHWGNAGFSVLSMDATTWAGGAGDRTVYPAIIGQPASPTTLMEIKWSEVLQH